ncbi:hypothetical protein [Komagataeibacter nataicola]|uniref:Uncharacterized protein n=2 Tax=Komagataeibacter nataicola TaxID=265960 RepID=A0ABX5PDL8_9PROT|nr:hypothetical protein [Komagataeibacter nataicola]PYD66302.1 hypothetical protein CDI09_09140 [Komagataeibacter nataicola]WNM10348.1 hypothetical protein RI056_18785 [Komagataeibacter nataicola]GBR23544.1 hypothetical protein AA0616_2549 [Komagataeibacter nataicola NRIC 0616]
MLRFINSKIGGNILLATSFLMALLALYFLLPFIFFMVTLGVIGIFGIYVIADIGTRYHGYQGVQFIYWLVNGDSKDLKLDIIRWFCGENYVNMLIDIEKRNAKARK